MAFLAGAVAAAAWLLLRPSGAKPSEPLPEDWPLTPRGVFSLDERRAHRLLREALPQHLILAKLPLVRFCQPMDPGSVRYWYELLGSVNVAFAICSSNGRVLAAIDLDGERSSSRRALQIKQSVLSACRVRYLHCRIDQLPSAAELQLLVPPNPGGPRAPQAGPATDAPDLDEARDSLTHTVATRRAERSALWQDSSLFQDSFFDAGDAPRGNAASRVDEGAPGDIVGVVTDHPQRTAPGPRVGNGG